MNIYLALIFVFIKYQYEIANQKISEYKESPYWRLFKFGICAFFNKIYHEFSFSCPTVLLGSYVEIAHCVNKYLYKRCNSEFGINDEYICDPLHIEMMQQKNHFKSETIPIRINALSEIIEELLTSGERKPPIKEVGDLIELIGIRCLCFIIKNEVDRNASLFFNEKTQEREENYHNYTEFIALYLKKEGFSENQAIGCIESFLDVLGENQVESLKFYKEIFPNSNFSPIEMFLAQQFYEVSHFSREFFEIPFPPKKEVN